MADSIQSLVIPKNRLPAKILQIYVKEGDAVKRDQKVALYKYSSSQTYESKAAYEANRSDIEKTSPNLDLNNQNVIHNSNGSVTVTKTIQTELRSLWEGDVVNIKYKSNVTVQNSDYIPRKNPLGVPFLTLKEPCSHAIQIQGLCAICGKDTTMGDFLGNDVGRATITMTHDASGVKVSREFAEKLENESMNVLRKQRKLALILDLDQTLIHATVESTVAHLMDNPNHPHHKSLKDTYRCILPGQPVIYYIKLRPGTRQFLEKMNKLFELHIYTMGTRSYANTIANILDPDCHLFNDRILSRDESGSFSQKNIARLFPCDQSMVIVVDDRSDVWSWSPNLYKIYPYVFFVGIGDINEPAKIAQSNDENNMNGINTNDMMSLQTQQAPQMTNDIIEAQEGIIISDGKRITPNINNKRPLNLNGSNTPYLGNKKVKLNDNSKSKDNEDTSDDETDDGDDDDLSWLVSDSTDTINDQKDKEMINGKKEISNDNIENEDEDDLPPHSNPLYDHDTELQIVETILVEVHRQYFKSLDDATGRNINPKATGADVGAIMKSMKRKVLSGVYIVFSGVIPLGSNPKSHDLWRGAEEFGAICELEINERTTHLVCTSLGTQKVRRAQKRKDVEIVSPGWLLKSITRWEKCSEESYTLGPSISIDENENNTLELEEERLDMEGINPEDIELANNKETGNVAVEADWDAMDEEIDAALDSSSEEDGDEDE